MHADLSGDDGVGFVVPAEEEAAFAVGDADHARRRAALRHDVA